MGKEIFESFEETILESIQSKRRKRPPRPASEDRDGPDNRGKLIVDATVAEQAIRYPTDLGLLNEAREISERLIDELYDLSTLTKKPRTYRIQARKRYLAVIKKRKATNNERPNMALGGIPPIQKLNLAA